MEQITIFKICDLHMNNRQMIACQPNRESVLDNGSSALQKQVNRILLAADGCEITTDLVLTACQSQLLMLLSQGEAWMSFGSNTVPVEETANSPFRVEVPIVVVEQLRAIDTDISADVMKSVALQITGKFPCLDFPDDDGFKDGKGFVMIKSKLINRNSYCKRFKEGKVVSSSRSDRSKQLNAKSGTLKEYWENTAAECPKAAHSILLRDEPDLLTDSVLEETQPFVRVLLNSQDTHKMLSKWPVLRRANLLKFHFEKATGRNLNDLSKYWNAKKTKMIDYSRTVKKTIPLGGEATTLQICTFLAFLVGEEINKLIINKEMGTSIDDIFTNEASPVIVGIDVGDDKHMYYAVAEKTRLTEGTFDVLEAVEQLMAVYYVYNFIQATRVGGRQRIVKRVIQALSTHELDAAATDE
ncbi:hypothetical protein quinque_009446 [Culex quinquefasciatus]